MSEFWEGTNLHRKGLSPRWILSWRRRFPRRLKVLPQREQANGPLKIVYKLEMKGTSYLILGSLAIGNSSILIDIDLIHSGNRRSSNWRDHPRSLDVFECIQREGIRLEDKLGTWKLVLGK